MTAELLFKQYGQMVSLCTAEGTKQRYKALIQPLRYKNKMYLDGIYTEIGFNSQGHYLYIGPADVDLTAVADGNFLSAGSMNYQIDRAEKVYAGEKVFYIWAIIRTIVKENY